MLGYVCFVGMQSEHAWRTFVLVSIEAKKSLNWDRKKMWWAFWLERLLDVLDRSPICWCNRSWSWPWRVQQLPKRTMQCEPSCFCCGNVARLGWKDSEFISPHSQHHPNPNPNKKFLAGLNYSCNNNWCESAQSWGTWCSGITPAQHAGGPGFNPQCVHNVVVCPC